jgi:hypothetical protein
MPAVIPWIIEGVEWALTTGLPYLILGGVSTIAQVVRSRSRSRADLGTQARNFTITGIQAAGPWRIVYGRAHLGGTYSFRHLTGTNKEFFHQIITLSGRKVYQINDMYFEDEMVPLDGNGDATGKFAGYVHVEKHTGDPNDTSQPFPGLAAAAPTKWTANHLQRGRAKAYVRLKWNADLFPNGNPNITFDIKGKEVWDPRTGTTGYSENVALCCRDYLADSTYGMAAASSELDDGAGGSIRAAANICDEDVNLNPSGTEKRYTANGAFETTSKPVDVLGDLLGAMAGYPTYINGKFGLLAGAWRTPTLTLTDGDLRGSIKYDARLSRSEIFNAVKGLYLCPTNKWQPADYPSWTNAGYEAEDGERIWHELNLPFTISSATAQRLAKIELERTRRQGTLTLPCKLAGYLAQPGDVIKETHARFGWDEKTFEVVGAKLAADLDASENPVLGVDLRCRETDSAVYNWSSGDQKITSGPPTLTLPDGNLVAAPTGLTLSDYSVQRADGIRVTYLKVVWTAPADEFVISGGKIHVEFKKVADSVYISAGAALGAATEHSIGRVDDAVNYDVRIRAENSYGALSVWVAGQHTVAGESAVLATGVTQKDAGGTGRHLLRYDDPAHSLDLVGDGGTYKKVANVNVSNLIQTGSVIANAINNNGQFLNDGWVDVTTETEVGSVTISTDGGSVEIFGKCSFQKTVSGASNVHLRLRKDSITGTVLDQVDVGIAAAVSAPAAAGLLGYDASPSASQTYKLTAAVDAGTIAVWLRRITVGNRKK